MFRGVLLFLPTLAYYYLFLLRVPLESKPTVCQFQVRANSSLKTRYYKSNIYQSKVANLVFTWEDITDGSVMENSLDFRTSFWCCGKYHCSYTFRVSIINISCTIQCFSNIINLILWINWLDIFLKIIFEFENQLTVWAPVRSALQTIMYPRDGFLILNRVS